MRPGSRLWGTALSYAGQLLYNCQEPRLPRVCDLCSVNVKSCPGTHPPSQSSKKREREECSWKNCFRPSLEMELLSPPSIHLVNSSFGQFSQRFWEMQRSCLLRKARITRIVRSNQQSGAAVWNLLGPTLRMWTLKPDPHLTIISNKILKLSDSESFFFFFSFFKSGHKDKDLVGQL